MSRIIIIGSGFSSLSAASYLAKAGNSVTIVEKNLDAGGRARQLKANGFTFDIGPTWYWMPDVFEKFFADFGKKPSDYYELKRLDPSYRIYYGKENSIDLPSSMVKLEELFESIEPGSSSKLRKFLKVAEKTYRIAVEGMVYKPGNSPLELITLETVSSLGLFTQSVRSLIKKHFKHPYLVKLLEFPVLFLGAKPGNIPAFYNFMNHADLVLGTWYPEGGMYGVTLAMKALAEEQGAAIRFGSEVKRLLVEEGEISGVELSSGEILECDIVVSGADYHHSEKLLPKEFRVYSEKYWDKKVFAPSALLFFVGINKRIKNILHHTLFFDEEFDAHAATIYDDPSWPEKPLFYASFPSKTDSECAPEGSENMTLLIPIAPGIEDTEEIRERYFKAIISRLEFLCDESITPHIVFKKSYCINDFISDYNSYKGNAYGLANTLMQTAFLRPKIKSKKVRNLFFTGQLTVPGPGVPPAIISGKIVSEEILKFEPATGHGL